MTRPWLGPGTTTATVDVLWPSGSRRTLALGATSPPPPSRDLRHVALSLWLNAAAPPAQIAARAGHSVTVLLTVYTHCVDGQGPDHQPADRTRAAPREHGAVPEIGTVQTATTTLTRIHE